MTIIPIKNGTTFISIECATLTQLEYSLDDDAWRCEYSDWAYGLFAMASAVMLLIPLFLIIYCVIKYQHRKKDPEFSRQTSVSTFNPDDMLQQFPHEDDELENVIRHHHKPRKYYYRNYFPYPAYGTFDEPSFAGSSNSLTALVQDDPVNQQQQQQQQQPRAEDQLKNLSSGIIIPGSSEQEPLLHISSSAPVITSMLRDQRENLLVKQFDTKNSPNRCSHCSVHSLIDFEKTADETCKDILSPDYVGSMPASSISTTTTVSGQQTAKKTFTEESDTILRTNQVDDNVKTDATLVDMEPEKYEENRNNTFQSAGNTHSLSNSSARTIDRTDNEDNMSDDKFRILSATPVKNMVSRQDFDDYLADCVLKLPEDQRNGTFLIRNSNSSPSSKVLTMYCKSAECNATLFYFRINFTDEGKAFIDETIQIFPSLDDLITFHKSNRSVLPCLLGDSLGKNF